MIARHRQEIVVACAVAIAFAVFTCFVSNNLEPRFHHRSETVQQQLAILHGQDFELDGVPTYFGAFQNRVLFPIALNGLSTFGRALSVSQWYLVLRLATAFGAALVVWWLLRRYAGARPKLAAVGVAVLAYELVFTFNHGWEHPTDFIDVALTALWLWAVLQHRFYSALAVAMVAALNRESAAFAGVLWVVLHGFSGPPLKLRPRQVGLGVILSATAYACVLCARWVFGGARAFQVNTNMSDIEETPERLWGAVIDFLHQPTPSSWPVLMAAMLIVLVGWLWANRSRWTHRERRLVFAAAVIFVLSLPFSKFEEPRDFMTSIVLLLFVAVSAEAAAGRHIVLGGLRNADAEHTANGLHAVTARTG